RDRPRGLSSRLLPTSASICLRNRSLPEALFWRVWSRSPSSIPGRVPAKQCATGGLQAGWMANKGQVVGVRNDPGAMRAKGVSPVAAPRVVAGISDHAGPDRVELAVPGAGEHIGVAVHRCGFRYACRARTSDHAPLDSTLIPGKEHLMRRGTTPSLFVACLAVAGCGTSDPDSSGADERSDPDSGPCVTYYADSNEVADRGQLVQLDFTFRYAATRSMRAGDGDTTMELDAQSQLEGTASQLACAWDTVEGGVRYDLVRNDGD